MNGYINNSSMRGLGFSFESRRVKMLVTAAYLNLVVVGLLVELHEISASVGETESLANTSRALL